MAHYLTSYYPNQPAVGLCNYLKVLFSSYRINKIINGDKIVPCVDKEFDWIYKSIYTNDEYINPNLVENLSGLAFDGSCQFLEDAVFAYEGSQRLYYFTDKIHYNVNNDTTVYKSNSDLGLRTYGWRFYVKPSDNVNLGPFANEWHLRDQTMCIDNRYTLIPDNMREIYLDIIKKFKILDPIQNHVNKEFSRLGDEFLSVHIRTWASGLWKESGPENIPQYNWYLKERSNYVSAINRSPLKKVLICTDNKSEMQLLLPHISTEKEIHFYEKSDDLNRMQNDFCELLLLSKGKHLIGTNNSTFSELAWWYGDCKQTVEIF